MRQLFSDVFFEGDASLYQRIFQPRNQQNLSKIEAIHASDLTQQEVHPDDSFLLTSYLTGTHISKCNIKSGQWLRLILGFSAKWKRYKTTQDEELRVADIHYVTHVIHSNTTIISETCWMENRVQMLQMWVHDKKP